MDQAVAGRVMAMQCHALALALAAACLFAGAGCGSGGGDGSGDPDASVGPDTSELPYGREVVSFSPGAGAGYGESNMPDVVLGPPDGKGRSQASLDVVSLGVGGEIVISFAGREIVDEPGVDLIIFENAFWPDGDPNSVWAELGQVAVSADGENWTEWPCDVEGTGGGQWPGCAGWRPTLEFDPFETETLDPEVTGGDDFDLADIGVESATYVRIRDLSSEGEAPSAGFDLDAVGTVNWR